MRKKYILEFTQNGANVKIEFLTIEQRDQFVIDATIINPIISEIEDEITLEP